MDHNNGYSKTFNKGAIDIIAREINSMVDWTYSNYCNGRYYADFTNNLEAGITIQDLWLIASIFPGDKVNQNRLFKLLAYYRPRSLFDYVYIPQWRWFEIAGNRSYLKFQQELINRRILDKVNNYKAGIFPKRFKINPFKAGGDYIQFDNRNIQRYDNILLNQDTDILKNKLKLDRMIIHRLKKMGQIAYT